MFVSTVAPVAEKAQSESDLDIRSAAGTNEDVVERDCKFRSSCIYTVIKYPIIFMNFCGIYVPSCCVCEDQQPKSNSKQKSASHDHYDVECTEVNAKTLIYVKSVDGHPENSKIVRGECPNADRLRWARLKKAATVLMFVVHSSNTVRYVFILKDTAKKTDSFMFSLTSYFILSWYFYLLVSCSHANFFHFPTFIASLFKYNTTYGLKSDFVSLARVHAFMFCAVLALQFVQSVFLVYGLLQFFDGFSPQLWPFVDVRGGWRIAIGLLCGVAVFFAGCNVFVTHFFRAAVVSLLRCEFRNVGGEFASVLSGPVDRHEEMFDQMLRKFRAVCDLRDKGHNVTKHTVATAYIFGMPMLCLVTYGLASGAMGLDQILILGFNVCMSVVILGHTTWTLASLNSEAGAVCDAVYTADWSRYPKRFLHK
ncbi:unnamed protein product, partial [Lymnaea stagnalis]